MLDVEVKHFNFQCSRHFRRSVTLLSYLSIFLNGELMSVSQENIKTYIYIGQGESIF